MHIHTKLLLTAVAAACLALPATASAGTASWTSPAPGSLNSSGVTIAFQTSSTDDNTLCLFERNGIFIQSAQTCSSFMGAPSGGTYSWSTSLTDGVYRLRVLDLSAATNPQLDTTFTVDAADPVVTINNGPAEGAYLKSNFVSIGYAVAEANPGQTFCGIGSTPQALTTPCSSTGVNVYPGLPEGPITLGVKHIDAAGRIGAAYRTFIIDTVPPTVALDGITNGANLKTRYPKFKIIAPDAVSVKCRFDDYDHKTSRTCESLSASPGLDDGKHTVHVFATDRAGNTTIQVITFYVFIRKGDDDRPAPSKVDLKKVSATARGGKLRATFSGAFKVNSRALDWSLACKGRVTAKFTGKIGGKAKSYSGSASLKQSGDSCTFKAGATLPKAWKGDKVKTSVSFPGNGEIGKFARSGRLKL